MQRLQRDRFMALRRSAQDRGLACEVIFPELKKVFSPYRASLFTPLRPGETFTAVVMRVTRVCILFLRLDTASHSASRMRTQIKVALYIASSATSVRILITRSFYANRNKLFTCGNKNYPSHSNNLKKKVKFYNFT